MLAKGTMPKCSFSGVYMTHKHRASKSACLVWNANIEVEGVRTKVRGVRGKVKCLRVEVKGFKSEV